MTPRDADRPRLFRLPTAKHRLRGEIERELRFHIEGRIEELVAQGYTREQAEREVRDRFGDVTTVRDECEEIDTMTHRKREFGEWRAALARDVQHAIRGLIQRPGFSAVVIATLALGIGATTAIYTLLDAVVLRPLPFAAPQELVVIKHPVPGMRDGAQWEMSQAGYFFFRKHARSFSDLGVFSRSETNLVTRDGAERARIVYVSASLFGVLRVAPHLGRALTDSDNRPNAPGVVIIGYDFWRTRFNSDPQIVGTTLLLGSRSTEIIGIAPRGFDLPDYQAQLWAPLTLDPDAPAQNSHYLQTIARLAPGTTVASAQADAIRLTNRLPEEFPNAYSSQFMSDTRFTASVGSLRDYVIGGMRRTLWILLGAVAIVLLIACANVANLFLVRAEARRREMTIRTALGAARSHLASHYLAESLTLATIGGALGAVLAYVAMRALLVLNPSFIPRLAELSFGWRPTLTAFLIAVAVGAVLGLLPLSRLVSGTLEPLALREGGRGQTASHRQLGARNVLIVAQMTLAVMLLAAAGLMLRSFERLRAVNPGLDARGVLTFDIMLPYSRYGGGRAPDPERYLPTFRFYQNIIAQISALPGVQSVATTTSLPIRDSGGCAGVFVEGRESVENDPSPCLPRALVSPGYFATMGIPVRGQTPTWANMEVTDGGVVISKALADRMWPGEDPIGKRLKANNFGEPYYRVVGVAGDVLSAGLDQAPSQYVYYPLMPMRGAPFWSPPTFASFAVRTTSGDPLALTASIRRILTAIDREVPMANVATMTDVVGRSTAKTTFAMILLGIAGGMALILSAVGIYGVISYTVNQRRAEIGVRMALGAQPSQVGRMVVAQSLRVAAVGIVIGLGAALATTRVMQSLLFNVSPTDPMTLGGVAAVLALLGALAAYAPARRATKVDPVEVLRRE
jgi:predicted permease